MLVDSHCHLHMLEPPLDVPGVLAEAAERGITHFLTVAVNLESGRQVIELARTYPQVWASVGVHPSETREAEASEEAIAALAADPAVVAVGETGLDYHYNEGDLEWQRERFRRHIRVARRLAKPLIVHTREAREDTVRLLREESAGEAGGVIHCFTEDYATAAACLDLGLYISFSGILTFRNAESLREVARRVPLERVLIETDSPYLAPVPHRGKPNQPAYVRYVAEQLAELKGMPVEEVARVTSENFFRLFGQAA